MSDYDPLLLFGGLALLIASPWIVRRHWKADFDEARMVAEGVPRPLSTALSAVIAVVPLFAAFLIFGSGALDDMAWAKPAFGIVSLAWIVLGCSLFFFLFPRFLIPPRIRDRQSLASRAFFGERSSKSEN